MIVKKIAVITYHRSYNYGAALQSYATVQLFEKMGYSVKIIDYYPENLRGFGTYRNAFQDVSNASRPFIIRCLLTLLKTPGYKKLKHAFDAFIDRELPLTNSYDSIEKMKCELSEFDIYCTGSDQVWNNYYTHVFDGAYFLDFAPENKPKIAFAASFGKSEFTDEECTYLHGKLSKYNYLSVRETTGVKIVQKIEGRNCDLMLDPTLMVDPKVWQEFEAESLITEKYILVYQLHGDSDTYNKARAAAIKFNLKVVRIITMPHQKVQGCINIITPDIRQFVTLFKNAEIVFTDSFHGTVFSVLYNKKLGITMPKRFGNRITTLVTAIGAEDLIIDEFEAWLQTDFSTLYSIVNPKLDKLREDKNKLFKERLEEIK